MRSLRNRTLIPRYPLKPRLSNTQPSTADRSEDHSHLTQGLSIQNTFVLITSRMMELNIVSRISLTISKVIRLSVRVGNLCFNEPSAGIAQAMPNTCMD